MVVDPQNWRCATFDGQRLGINLVNGHYQPTAADDPVSETNGLVFYFSKYFGNHHNDGLLGVGITRHYLSVVWFGFGEGDAAGPPFGSPSHRGMEGASWLSISAFACYKPRCRAARVFSMRLAAIIRCLMSLDWRACRIVT